MFLIISGVVCFLVLIVYFLFYFMSYSSVVDAESITPYECGFDPSILCRVEFSYRFFLISILFLIFDVEITLMLPIPYIMGSLMGLWVFIIFIFILLSGLCYEYYYGSLEWLD